MTRDSPDGAPSMGQSESSINKLQRLRVDRLRVLDGLVNVSRSYYKFQVQTEQFVWKMQDRAGPERGRYAS